MLEKMNFLETEAGKYPIIFTINVMEAIQEKYGSFDNWNKLVQQKGEPDIKAIKFFMMEAINEGIDIQNERTHENRAFVTEKQVGRILTEVGFRESASKIFKTISDSVLTENSPKNKLAAKNLKLK